MSNYFEYYAFILERHTGVLSEEKIQLILQLNYTKAVLNFTLNQEEHFKFEVLILIKLPSCNYCIKPC